MVDIPRGDDDFSLDSRQSLQQLVQAIFGGLCLMDTEAYRIFCFGFFLKGFISPGAFIFSSILFFTTDDGGRGAGIAD